MKPLWMSAFALAAAGLAAPAWSQNGAMWTDPGGGVGPCGEEGVAVRR